MKPWRHPPPPSETDDTPSRSSLQALDWAVSRGAVDEVLARVQTRLRQRRRQRLGAATAVSCLLLAVALLWQREPVPESHPAAPVVIVPRREVLPDGTVVELNDGARLTVAFTTAFRRVSLERGEAHFQVAKNPQRPFIVTAGGVEVRAVGTAFAVQLGPRAVEVLVTEGRVAVEKPVHDAAGSAPAALHYADVDAGNRVRVDLAGLSVPAPIMAVSPEEVDERLSWRVPRLELVGTPLAQTLVLFNRHASAHLVLADASLGDLELSGVIRADNVDSLLRVLRTEFKIEAERRGGEIILRRR